MFDPDTFMQQAVDGPLETEYKMVPQGEYSNVYIGDFDSKAFTARDWQKDSKQGTLHNFNIPFVINDAKAAAAVGRDDGKVTVYMDVLLDMKTDGGLDTGVNKNLRLGQVRDAAGQNSPGIPLSNLRGAGPFVVTVVHESGERKDKSKWQKATIGKITRQTT